MSTITREQAEAVLAVVRKRYRCYFEPVLNDAGKVLLPAPGEDDQPQLFENYHGRRGSWAVVWESGPDEWAMRFSLGGLNEEVAAYLHQEAGWTPSAAGRAAVEAPVVVEVPGVHVEAWESFSLGIYED
jgi:hypothetical protein